MAISLKHDFVSGKADGLDTTKVQPSNWNAEHALTMATARLIGRTTASAGPAEEIAVSSDLSLAAGVLGLGFTTTAFAKTLLDDADAATARTTLALGTVATQNANDVALTGGTINNTPIGGTTRAAGNFTTVSTTGNVSLASTAPSVALDQTNGTSTHRQTWLVQFNNEFQLQARNSTGDFIANDYIIARNASGATSHAWRIGGSDRLNLTNAGLVVTGWISVNTSSESIITRIRPTSDNSGFLGTLSTAYASVVSYAITNLSDARLKEEIADLTEAELRAAKKIKLRTFRWKETGDKKIGYIAQEVIEAMASEGLCAFEYGLVTGSEETRFGVDMDAINAFRLEALSYCGGASD